jgi:hypothetical protein
VGDAKVASIFIEVKVYDDSKSRKGLLDGFAQLHAYLNAREADDVFMEEAYYVIYRLGGTLYDFPDKIHTNRHIIYILVIDLGESNDSGRKQPKPISIKRKDLISMIVRGRRGGTADRRRRWWGRDVRKRKGTL